MDMKLRDKFNQLWKKYFKQDELPVAFSVPMKKFVKMINNMDESFLTTQTWKDICQ